MNAAVAEHARFDPPPQRGRLRALGLAVLAHLLLVWALTWGLHWKNQPQNEAIEAELWSPTVRQAAPRPPPPPPPEPVPQPPAPPPPPPQSSVTEDRDAEIALEQKKKRQEAERKLAEERQKQEQAKKKAEEQAAKAKAQEDARRAAEAAEKKAAAEAKRKEEAAEKAAKAQEEARRVAALRDMSKWAGTADNGNGNAARASGPSGDYAARIRALLHNNIVFTDNVPGNPETEVEVVVDEKTGIITGRRITKSSGIKSWDIAVLRALDRVRTLPDDHGRYWNPMLITFHPND